MEKAHTNPTTPSYLPKHCTVVDYLQACRRAAVSMPPPRPPLQSLLTSHRSDTATAQSLSLSSGTVTRLHIGIFVVPSPPLASAPLLPPPFTFVAGLGECGEGREGERSGKILSFSCPLLSKRDREEDLERVKER
ncbi:unnamed protein product [Linum trigynum]|uniref:Uncharacterized protein n=1 Tax=Linum trigynum TaxID=586398 RepID=A0AAV2E145_9ROSI